MSGHVDVLKLNDVHVPFQDETAVKAAFKFAKWLQPDIIVIDEWNDFYAISRFSKDPERISSLQDEIDEGVALRKTIRRICPDSRIIEVESNHMKRLRKYLWSNAKELASLRSLNIPALFDLPNTGIEYTDHFAYRGFMFKHGDIVRKHSGYSARAEFDREGMSGASGHTHRLSQYYNTLRGGKYVWMECGCMCNLRPEWYDGIPNWQHGMGLVRFKGKSKHFTATPLPIIDGEVIWGR